MLLRVILWTIILMMLLRFVVRFLFPVINASKTINDRLKQMQQQMNDMQEKQQTKKPTPTVKQGDYIEYEEVK